MSDITHIHPKAEPVRIHYINEWMEKRGVKQADLVKQLHVDKGTVSKWCSGKLPQETNLIALAAYFHIEPAALFRHPDDDWIQRLFAGRSAEELKRIADTIEAAFPRQNGTKA